MDLAELKFVVDTKDLETAATRVAELGTAVSKLNKPMQDLTKESAKTNKELSKAEEAAAKAALAQTKLEQAQNKSVQAANKSNSVLERQNMILEFMAQGNSKGQASILATAKAAGALDDEMLQLNKTLVTQRTLIGGDPFDKSIGLMQKLQNEYKTTNEVTALFNRNLGLTQKQMTDLAREKERLVALYGIEGKSLNGLSAEYEQLIQKSTMINRANTERTNAMKSQIKAQDDAAKSNAYLVSEMERVNRLTESNGTITTTVNNKLIKFEQALKSSGKTASEQVAALEKYKTSLLSIQKAGGDRQVDYLSRALGPQITDIAVGLATGQAPLTILLQQGGQLRDQFALAGVEGAKMGEMLIKAAGSMITSIKDVGVAVGQVFVRAVAGAGESVVNFAMKITGTDALLDAFRSKLVSVSSENSLLVKSFDLLGKGVIAFTGIIVFTAIAALVSFGVAISKIIKEENELNRALNLTGAAMGVNMDSAYAAAKGMEQFGVSTGTAIAVLTQMAKVGGMSAESLKTVAVTANSLKTAFNIPIEETVKKFKELQEKPTESLAKLAQQLGTIPVEILKQVQAYEKAGNSIKAAELATKTYADAGKDAADRTVQNFGTITKLGISLGKIWDKTWESIMGIGRIDTNEEKITNLSKRLVTLLAAQDPRQIESRKPLVDATIAEIKQVALLIAEEKKLEEQRAKNASDAKKFESENKKKSESKVERAIVVPVSRDIAIVQKDFNEQLRLAEGFAKDERSILKARFDAGLIDRAEFITRDTELLSRSEQQQLGIVESFRGKYKTAYEAQAKLLRDAFGNTKDEENRRVLQTSIDNLEKDFAEFNSTLDDTKTKLASVFNAREQVALLEFEKAAFESTKTLREYTKAQEDATNNRRIDAEVQSRLLNAYGAEAVKIKAVADETKRQTAEISKFTIAQQRAFEAFQSTLNNPKATGSERGVAYRAYITAMENANKAISTSRVSIENAGTDAVVAYYQQEYQRISSGVTDSIVTALFEGGKAGSRKLRDLVVAELRKPITIVVKALVDATLGNFIQSVIGGGGGSFAGSAAGSASTGGISNLSIGGATIGAQAGAFGQGVMSGFSFGAPVSSMGGATSASFNAGATYGAPIAGAVGGMAINRGISNGYEVSGTMNTIQDIGTIIAAAINPIFGIIAGTAAGVFNRAFGRKLTDVGVRGTLGGETGFEGERYTFEKGGFLRSDKTRTSVLEEADRSAIASDFRLIKGSIMDLAESAGFGTKAIDNFTTKFQINLKDLSPEQAVKRYQEEFAKVEEAMAAAVIGSTKYRRENETNVQALTRLSSFMSGVNNAFEKLGFQAYKLELASIDAAQSFVDLFGGLEGLNKAFTFFYENFFSDAEKTSNLTRDLTESFSDLGLALPKTREDFKALVLAAKAAGDDSQVKNLLDLQYAFAELVPVTEGVVDAINTITETMKGLLKERSNLEIELLQVQGKTDEANAALRKIAIQGFTEAEIAAYDYNQSLRDQIQSYKDAKQAAEDNRRALVSNTDIAYAALERSVNAQKRSIDDSIKSKQKEIDVLQNQRKNTESSINILKSLFDFLGKNIKDLYQEVESTASVGYRTARSFISSVATGRVSATEDELSDAIGSVRSGIDQTYYKTKADSERDRIILANELTEIQELTDTQLTNEEKMLVSFDNQISLLEDQIGALTNQKVVLDELLVSFKEQIDVMRGIDTSVLSVKEAINNLASAISAEAAISAAKNATATTAAASAPYSIEDTGAVRQAKVEFQTGLSLSTADTPELAAAKVLYQSVTGGASSEQYNSALAAIGGSFSNIGWDGSREGAAELVEKFGGTIKARANGGYTSPGLTLLGEEGPELVNFNRPGMVYTAGQTAGLLGGSSEELAAIRQELVMLRAEVRADVSHNAKTAKILSRVTPDGETLAVSATIDGGAL